MDTGPLHAALTSQHPNIQIATWQKADDGYRAYWTESPKQMAAPVPGDHEYDVIFVPLLGFNDACFRIGFGGGFYDRFLATQPDALTIGLCYQAGYAGGFQPENHDIPLVHVITEAQRYSRKPI